MSGKKHTPPTKLVLASPDGKFRVRIALAGGPEAQDLQATLLLPDDHGAWKPIPSSDPCNLVRWHRTPLGWAR